MAEKKVKKTKFYVRLEKGVNITDFHLFGDTDQHNCPRGMLLELELDNLQHRHIAEQCCSPNPIVEDPVKQEKAK